MSTIIRTDIERPPKELIDEFRQIPTTIISDAMNRMNCMGAGIKPVVEGTRIAGPAVTVQCMVGSNIMSHQIIYLARKGDVIVIDARGHKNTAVWGYLQTYASKLRGLEGVVIDGSVRDIQEIRESKFPVFCMGAVPAGPHKGWGDNINVPVQCGGAPVMPGDIVIGDDDGVVTVPLKLATKILKDAKKRLKIEEDWFRRLDKGESTLEILGLDKKIKEMVEKGSQNDN